MDIERAVDPVQKSPVYETVQLPRIVLRRWDITSARHIQKLSHDGKPEASNSSPRRYKYVYENDHLEFAREDDAPRSRGNTGQR